MRIRPLIGLVTVCAICAAGCSGSGQASNQPATTGSMTQGDSLGNFVTGQILRSSSKSLNDPTRALATAKEPPEQD